MGERCRFYADVQSVQTDVTGSGTLVTVSYPGGEKEMFIVDFGMYQGSEEQMKQNFKLNFLPKNLCGILLTHAHVDHSGRIPMLYKNGAFCRTYMTEDTLIIAEKLLRNTAMINANWNQQGDNSPMYLQEDVEVATKEFRTCGYKEEFDMTEHIHVSFFKNNHIPGAAIIFVRISYGNLKNITMQFSGDYNDIHPFTEWRMSMPSVVSENPISFMLIESTYGAKKEDFEVGKFKREVSEYVKQGKDILIPAFAFGRFQNVLLQLKQLQDEDLLSKNIPIFIDGGLGIDITQTWTKLETVELKEFMPENVSIVESRKMVMHSKFSKIIVTTSGMGNFGPAREYIPYYISESDAVIYLTGYTAPESAARKILEAQIGEIIQIHGIMREKKAIVTFTEEFSSHARKPKLIEYVKSQKKINFLLVNHGSPEARFELAKSCSSLENVKDVGILDGRTDFRINAWGLVKTLKI